MNLAKLQHIVDDLNQSMREYATTGDATREKLIFMQERYQEVLKNFMELVERSL